jgi:hypothetical protein
MYNSTLNQTRRTEAVLLPKHHAAGLVSFSLGVMKTSQQFLFRILLIVGVTLGVVTFAAIGWFWLFAPDMCGNEIISEFPSPEGNKKVVVFQRDCGATTGFSTQASILGNDQVLENESGNLFTSDTNHGAAPSSLGGGPALSVEWKSKHSVLLSFHPNARVFKKEAEIDGVHVSYSESSAQQVAPRDAPKAASP